MFYQLRLFVKQSGVTASSRLWSAADARRQLSRIEGPGQIIIGAQLQADDLVGILGAGRQHQDRDVALAANLAAHAEAVQARQHDVQDDQIRAMLVDLFEALRPARGSNDPEAVLLEVQAR